MLSPKYLSTKLLTQENPWELFQAPCYSSNLLLIPFLLCYLNYEMKQEAVLQSTWSALPFCIKLLWHFPYISPILICMFPNNCLGLWPQWYMQKSFFYGFRNNNNKK